MNRIYNVLTVLFIVLSLVFSCDKTEAFKDTIVKPKPGDTITFALPVEKVPPVLSKPVFNVIDFGAKGDGSTLNTEAIQAACNACAGTGGSVLIKGGVFVTGSFTLGDNTTLYIDSTAVLKGSGSIDHYPDLNPPTVNNQRSNCKKALIFAVGKHDVKIDGGGMIDGNGRTNFLSGKEYTRPIPLWTVLCKKVTIQNITIKNSSMWSCVNMESDSLTIRNVKVDANLPGNRDGLDIVDCHHGLIQDCYINSGDDAICFKSGIGRGVDDFIVRNCIVTAGSNGLKFGTASYGQFKNVTFEDCYVSGVKHSAIALESVNGSDIGNIIFQRITVTNCPHPIFVILGDKGVNPPSGYPKKVGSVNNVKFLNITGSNIKETQGCILSGTTVNGTTYKLQDILFDHVNIVFKGGLKVIPSDPGEYAGEYPENSMWGNMPAYGYYIRHANNITFTNCTTSAVSDDARNAFVTVDVSNFNKD